MIHKWANILKFHWLFIYNKYWKVFGHQNKIKTQQKFFSFKKFWLNAIYLGIYELVIKDDGAINQALISLYSSLPCVCCKLLFCLFGVSVTEAE